MRLLFLPGFAYKPLDRVEIAIADIIDEGIFGSRSDPCVGRKIILRDVDSERVSPALDKSLVGDLTFPRKEPIDKNLRRVGVRRSIDQSDVTAARPYQPPSLNLSVSNAFTGKPCFFASHKRIRSAFCKADMAYLP